MQNSECSTVIKTEKTKSNKNLKLRSLQKNTNSTKKYAFSRLTDNENFEHTLLYLASSHINDFRKYKSKSKISNEIC